ncbi:MAG: AEC family transporter [Eubacteriales bacterium]|nr:AEC family transporter [Eubacteriales bacterium]
MDNLIFSLNATVPLFLTMLVGLFLRRIGMMDESFTSNLNKFVFKVTLPVMLFRDLSTQNFVEAWDTKFVVFCFIVTAVTISAICLLSFVAVKRDQQGEFIQSSYRSSAAILGLAFIQNIYGNSGMGPLMIIASVPLYNIMAVTVLSFFKPDRGAMDKKLIMDTVKGVLTNPIIIGIFAGLIWSLIGPPIPQILQKTISNVAVLTTPLGLMAMGASFDIKLAGQCVKPALIASFIKLIALPLVFLPMAVVLGFRNSELIAILVMLGSSTTVTSFVMAKNMGHSGQLSASTVMITTAGSAFTLTFWLFVCRSLGFIKNLMVTCKS